MSALFIVVLLLALVGALHSGIWVDTGLETMQMLILGDFPGPPALTVQPYTNSALSPTQSTVYTDLTFDSAASGINYSGGWGYNLDTTAHQDVAQKALQWNFPSDGSADGKSFYGIAVYDASLALYYIEPFASTFTVAVGNRTLIVNSTQTRKDCST